MSTYPNMTAFVKAVRAAIEYAPNDEIAQQLRDLLATVVTTPA